MKHTIQTCEDFTTCPITRCDNHSLSMKTSGTTGADLSSLEWLSLHHRVKLSHRWRAVDALPFRPGQRVLDLGCGPGLWAWMIAERVLPGGSVLGIDLDEISLAAAEANRPSHLPTGAATFEVADFTNLPFDSKSFDVTFFSNGFVFLRDPRIALQEQIRVTRADGYVIGRHFDNTCLMIQPVPVKLLTEVAHAAAVAQESLEPYFDNSVGQRMHGFFSEAGLVDVATHTYAVQLTGPLSTDAQRYVGITASWYAHLAKSTLSPKRREEWLSLFDASSDQYILDKSTTYFCCLEMETIGRVPA